VKKNESGITLVELLATLSLLSIVVVLIWTTFFITTKHNVTETSKLRLQQEANYILTEIQQQHRHLDCYELEIEENKIKLLNCEEPSALIKVISSGYKYGVYSSSQIYPKKEDLPFTLIISDPINNKQKVTVETTITRFKSD